MPTREFHLSSYALYLAPVEVRFSVQKRGRVTYLHGWEETEAHWDGRRLDWLFHRFHRSDYSSLDSDAAIISALFVRLWVPSSALRNNGISTRAWLRCPSASFIDGKSPDIGMSHWGHNYQAAGMRLSTFKPLWRRHHWQVWGFLRGAW